MKPQRERLVAILAAIDELYPDSRSYRIYTYLQEAANLTAPLIALHADLEYLLNERVIEPFFKSIDEFDPPRPRYKIIRRLK